MRSGFMGFPKNIFARSLGAALVVAGSTFDVGAAYPERPIEVIVPFAAGGGSDVFARILQKEIRENELSPHPFVVVNAGGAGGTIGSRKARDAKPDGYTILCLHDGIFTAQHYGNADWGAADFEPIAATGQAGVIVAVADGSRFKDLDALMHETKERPYQVVYGTNLGAPSHYSAVFLQEGRPGARFRFTQSGGGAKRLAQLKGGHVDATGFSVSEYVQFRDAGIRALAVLNAERVLALPEIFNDKVKLDDEDIARIDGLDCNDRQASPEKQAHCVCLIAN